MRYTAGSQSDPRSTYPPPRERPPDGEEPAHEPVDTDEFAIFARSSGLTRIAMPNSNAKTPRTTGNHQKRPGRICGSAPRPALIRLSR